MRVLRLISFRQTYPVFSLSDLEDLELLPAGAERHLSVDFVVDPFGVSEWTPVLPVRPEGSDELPPVDHAVAVVKLVGHSVHLQLRRRELVLQNAVNEVVPELIKSIA